MSFGTRNQSESELNYSYQKLELNIGDFITKLFKNLHTMYGKDTKVVINEFGGFDFRDKETNEFV